MSATSWTSSRQRWKESQASPLGSSVPDEGSCSHAHQSLFTLPPSIWCAAVATPQMNPSGNTSSPSSGAVAGVMAPQGSWATAGRAPPRHDPTACEHGRMSTSLEFLVDLLDLEPIEVNIFRGIQPNEERQRVFGGQVAGQALMAAGRTVEHGRVHSLHSYFLRPGDPTVPILYEVDRIRDGRSFTTRRVVAIQHGRAIFNLSASFHDLEEGLEHQFPMPEVPAPESLAPLSERLEPWREELAEWFDRPHPIDQRHIGDLPWHSEGTGGALPAAVDPGRRRPARRSPAPRLCRHLRVGHVPDRHHPGPPRRPLGRPGLHGCQPGPLHVVPPAVPGRRLAALRHGLARGGGRPRPGPRLPLRPGRAVCASPWSKRAWRVPTRAITAGQPTESRGTDGER